MNAPNIPTAERAIESLGRGIIRQSFNHKDLEFFVQYSHYNEVFHCKVINEPDKSIRSPSYDIFITRQMYIDYDTVKQMEEFLRSKISKAMDFFFGNNDTYPRDFTLEEIDAAKDEIAKA